MNRQIFDNATRIFFVGLGSLVSSMTLLSMATTTFRLV
jgi:hypothetical protein